MNPSQGSDGDVESLPGREARITMLRGAMKPGDDASTNGQIREAKREESSASVIHVGMPDNAATMVFLWSSFATQLARSARLPHYECAAA